LGKEAAWEKRSKRDATNDTAKNCYNSKKCGQESAREETGLPQPITAENMEATDSEQLPSKIVESKNSVGKK